MKEDVGTSKLKKHANKVNMLTYDPKLNKPLPYNRTQVQHINLHNYNSLYFAL